MVYTPDDIAFEKAGSGPAMILVHGCPATHTLWRPLMSELARHRTLYAIDLPGFGESRAPDDASVLSLPGLADALLAFADHHCLDRFDIVGHSFGAAIAASTAAAADDRVRTLVMIAPMGVEPPRAVLLARTAIIRRVAAPLWRVTPPALRRACVRAATRANYGPAYDRARAHEVAAELDRGDALRSICRLVGAFDYNEYRTRLEKLKRDARVPTLAIGAADDRVIPHHHFASLCDLLQPQARESYDDGVHVLMWQHPDAIARSITAFIDGDAHRTGETS